VVSTRYPHARFRKSIGLAAKGCVATALGEPSEPGGTGVGVETGAGIWIPARHSIAWAKASHLLISPAASFFVIASIHCSACSDQGFTYEGIVNFYKNMKNQFAQYLLISNFRMQLALKNRCYCLRVTQSARDSVAPMIKVTVLPLRFGKMRRRITSIKLASKRDGNSGFAKLFQNF
jgi:hypothetical protein